MKNGTKDQAEVKSSVQFTGFALENFKGIVKKVSVDISNNSGQPFCFVGNNECGKTTILKGVELIGRLCQGYVLQNGELNEARKTGAVFSKTITLQATVKCTNISESVCGYDKISQNAGIIDIIFKYPFKDSKHDALNTTMELITNGNSLLEVKYVADGAGRYKYADIDDESKKELLQFIHNFLPQIRYYDDFMFDVPESVKFLKDAQTDVLLSKNEQNTVWQQVFDNLFKASVGMNCSFKEGVVDWAKNNNNDTASVQNRISTMNEKLKKITGEWENLIGEKAIFDYFDIQPCNDTSDEKFKVFRISVRAKETTHAVHSRSKGCQWFFCFKVFTDIARSGDKNGTIFLLDEPASNLHINAQSRVLKSLGLLTKDNNSVVIYSTHSPFLINSSDDSIENIFLIDNGIKTDEFSEEMDISVTKIKDAKDRYNELTQAMMPVYISALNTKVIIEADIDVSSPKKTYEALKKICEKVNENPITKLILDILKVAPAAAKGAAKIAEIVS